MSKEPETFFPTDGLETPPQNGAKKCRHLFKNGSRHCTNAPINGGDRCLFHQNDELDWTEPYARKLILEAAKNGTLEEAQLAGANLANADLSHCNLKGADLHGADLTAANLAHADCRNASFAGASLLGADLTRTDCARANFDNADCQLAQFDGTVLRKISCFQTDLRRTNLSKAIIAADALAHAKTDDKTTWPEVTPDGASGLIETNEWVAQPSPSDKPKRHQANTPTSERHKAPTETFPPRKSRSWTSVFLTSSACLFAGLTLGWYAQHVIPPNSSPINLESKTFEEPPEFAQKITQLTVERDELLQKLSNDEATIEQLQKKLKAASSTMYDEALQLRYKISLLQQQADSGIQAKIENRQLRDQLTRLQEDLTATKRTAAILMDGVTSLQDENKKMKTVLQRTTESELLLLQAEGQVKQLQEELKHSEDARLALATRSQQYEQELIKTTQQVNNLFANIAGTRLQGMLDAQSTGQKIALRPGDNATLVTKRHAISVTADQESTGTGTITLQGRANDALPRIICVFHDQQDRPLRKLTIDFGDHRLDKGFVTLRYDTGLGQDPVGVSITVIDPVIDRVLANKTPEKQRL